MSQSSEAAGLQESGARSEGWGMGAAAGEGERLKFVSFAIGSEQYGVDIMSVREIKVWTDATNLPKQPDYVRGVLNLRGVIVPIVDLRRRFGQGHTEATASNIVIIVQIGARLVGMLADRVLDIVSLDASKIQPVPRISNSARIDFLSGLITVDGALIALIDLPNLLAADEQVHEQRAGNLQ
jgi:purine-binding chemotaxis protein CheW